MFVQARQLHIQRHHNQHHQRQSPSSRQSHWKIAATNSLPPGQPKCRDAEPEAKPITKTVQRHKEHRNYQIECIEFQDSGLIPVPPNPPKRHNQKAFRLTSHSGQVTSRSRSLDLQASPASIVYLGKLQGQQQAFTTGKLAQDLKWPQQAISRAHQYGRNELEPKYSQLASQQRISGPETNSKLLDSYHDDTPIAKRFDVCKTNEIETRSINDDGCCSVSRCQNRVLQLHKNSMNDSAETPVTCSSAPRFSSRSNVFYDKFLNRFISYFLFIGHLLKSRLRSRLWILNQSKKNLEIVSSFCWNFVVYQLETWALLVQTGDVSHEILTRSKQCKSCSTAVNSLVGEPDSNSSKQTSDRLGWRSRDNQFNRSVDEMYGAARFGRSRNRSAEHWHHAHLNGRHSTITTVDRQSLDRQIQANPYSLRRVSGAISSPARERSNQERSLLSSRLTSEDSGTGLSANSNANFCPGQQSSKDRWNAADSTVSPSRPDSLLIDSYGSRLPPDNAILESGHSKEYSFSGESRSTVSRMRLCSNPFSANIATFNHHYNASSDQHLSQNHKPHPSAHRGSDHHNKGPDIRYPLSLSVKSSDDWTGPRMDVVRQPATFNSYLRGNRQNNLVYSEQIDQNVLVYSMENGDSRSIYNNDHSSILNIDNAEASKNLLIAGDVSGPSHGLWSSAGQLGTVASNAEQGSRQQSDLPEDLLLPSSDSRNNSPRRTENGRNKAGRPKSVASFELKTRSTSSNSSKKSSSYNKLSLAGAKKRLGLTQKGLSSISVQRSEEVVPMKVSHLVRQSTVASTVIDSRSDSMTQLTNQFKAALSNSRSNGMLTNLGSGFVSGLGQGQIASRQALVSPYLGDIQLAMSDQRGLLEVEVVRASGLHARSGSIGLPSPSVKLYLIRGKKCLAKYKTRSIKETLDPLFQEKFTFRHDYTDCILQVIVWGDYGKKSNRKSLMGIVQIKLNDLNMSSLLIGWYQLFNAPSIVSSLLPSEAMRQTMIAKDMGNGRRW